jgi:iron(III) transport system substrate-binding protein
VHVNISAFGMTRATRNRKAAVSLMEYVVQPAAQRLYADAEMDYPIVAGLRAHALLNELGPYTEDPLPLHNLAKHYPAAEVISREEGWLWK